MKKRKLSAISTLHYIRLFYRSALFVMLLISYLSYRLRADETITSKLEQQPVILVVMWSVFVVEMVLRFFPSPLESPGSQKQFKQNYIKSGERDLNLMRQPFVILRTGLGYLPGMNCLL